MGIKKGLYESIVNKIISKEMHICSDDLDIYTESMDSSEAKMLLASYLHNILIKGLGYYSSSEDGTKKQIEISNSLLQSFSSLVEDEEFAEFSIESDLVLKAVLEKCDIRKPLSGIYPATSISRSTLFTGSAGDPSVFSELNREILHSDRVDLLVSFIKFSGLRLIMDSLKEHTKSKKLRVITTSYMGASDYKAIKMLSELPNTEVKISYDTERTRLHAKAYYFHRETGFSTAYIGSSNLSKSALSEGTEWNLKISEHSSPEVIDKYRMTFESYWNSEEFRPFSPHSLEDNMLLKGSLSNEYRVGKPHVQFDIRPYAYQQEMLDKLEVERNVHDSRRNLIVAATGTGKTVVAAFDFRRYYRENPGCKLLFISHRKEILIQSLETFQWIVKDYNFGDLWVGEYSPSSNSHLFASVQTLNSSSNFQSFESDYFDYIVVDETHHGASDSYDKILSYFEPDILLGLTATPERMDGEDILKYFDNRIACEIRLHDAISRELLCPFHYFGITDSVSLDSVKWARGKYDVSELENLYTGNDRRAELVVESLDKYLPSVETTAGVGFCVSRSHAEYMSRYFNANGIPSIHLDSNSPDSYRRNAKSRLQSGEIKFIFVVDLYNEGVDIPEINTVLFLRPTESSTVFLQQLGRGLRISENKDVLTVLDFVGQCSADFSFRSKMRALVGKSDRSIEREIEQEFPSLPSGCYLHLERKSKEYILENLKKTYVNKNKLRRMMSNYRHETEKPLTLSNFLDHYSLLPSELYRYSTLSELMHLEDLSEELVAEDMKALKNALRRIMSMNSLKLIDFLAGYLVRDRYTLEGLTEEELSMLMMFHYTVWTVSPEGDLIGYLNRLRYKNSSLFDEMLELLEYNRRSVDFIEKNVKLGFPSPLTLHSRYTTDQVLAALGEHTELKKRSFREGVLYLRDKDMDVFFITLQKSEREFSSTTQYDDYAISESLFHWQSQSRTSDTSPTGQRYVNQGRSKHNVLLFVREKKTEDGMAAPFHFLGKANYVSHSGLKPISIVWKLEQSMPSSLFRKSNKAVNII